MDETEVLENELDLAQGELQKLLDEQATIGAVVQQATQGEVVDVKALIKHQTRADELPKYIFAARVKMQRARIAALESRERNEGAEVTVAQEVTHEKWQQRQAADAEWQAAVNTKDALLSARNMTRSDLGSARRDLEDLVAINSKPHAPIVRSLPHARFAG